MALRKLKSKHHQLALMVTAGKSPEEIGQALGMHANSVNRLRRDPMIQARIEEVRQEVQALVVADLAERIDLLAPKALDRVEDLLDTGPPGIRLKAAEQIMDRSSNVPKRVLHATHDVQNNVVVFHATAAWLEEAKVAMLEVGVDESMLPPINPDGETITLDRDTGKIVSLKGNYSEET